ncbi:ribonuclease N [Nocardioides mangrovicus]|uniref:Ribonuclease N n=1 Tax=Nocardioides mangrovicus TaxID=2478913 RepID=A0A3L8P1C0_9ACTN|nr:ribonuclease domain-containing protein [Nocardioides mangrovicus]RLV48944.1 ribonuclease N [Nocardioides mangrovicus]
MAESRVASVLERVVVVLLVVLVLVGGWTFLHSGKSHADPATSSDTGSSYVAESALSGAARSAVSRIDAGGPFPSSTDGTVYRNDAHLLPTQPTGYYHRYGVSGSALIVQGQDGTLYYSADAKRFEQIKR